MMQKTAKNVSKPEESTAELMRNLMKTFSCDYQKLSTVSSPKSMMNHYCSSPQKSDVGSGCPLGDKETNYSTEKSSTEKHALSSAGKLSLMDQLTNHTDRFGSEEKSKVAVVNVRALVAEAQIKNHLIVDEFMRNINPIAKSTKKLKTA